MSTSDVIVNIELTSLSSGEMSMLTMMKTIDETTMMIIMNAVLKMNLSLYIVLSIAYRV